MDSEFLKEINCVYLSAKQVVCIRWIQNWIIGSEWFHIFVHNMEATVVSNLERSVAWEGFRPLKTGIEEVTRYVQISVSRLQRNHICFFPGKKSQIFKIDTVYTELFCCLYIRLQIKFIISFWHHIQHVQHLHIKWKFWHLYDISWDNPGSSSGWTPLMTVTVWSLGWRFRPWTLSGCSRSLVSLSSISVPLPISISFKSVIPFCISWVSWHHNFIKS